MCWGKWPLCSKLPITLKFELSIYRKDLIDTAIIKVLVIRVKKKFGLCISFQLKLDSLRVPIVIRLPKVEHAVLLHVQGYVCTHTARIHSSRAGVQIKVAALINVNTP